MRKTLTILGVIVLLVAIVVGVGQWVNNSNNPPGPGQHQAERPGGDTNQPEDSTNPPGCVAVEVLAAPGTWESRADDDPMNPSANPNSLLLEVTNPLKQQFDPSQVKVWTLPYTAQFRNINAQHEMSYDDSRQEGYSKLAAELTQTHEACPGTKFIIVGFSQGAVIGGDMASDIGNDRGPVPADTIGGVALIADGRMEAGRGTLVGDTSIGGTGAEIALQAVGPLIQGIVPGASMRGPRPDGFNQLNDRVFNLCAKEDLVCDAPVGIGNAIGRAQDLIAANAVHAQYATNGTVVPGQTAPQWIVGWAGDLIRERL
ncbi:cutinase family protein [Corynebacterium sp. 319]|uniref:cutinase family protein n=1 Tax=unclassified Corynebacterium TaxID=2624378 RepID=UPI00125CCF1A|nr:MULTISPECIES: cutinase family protein [unclassified Corynebacterium]KAB1554218.1 cutinase family protein [Corynebacterium sp. 319]KAB3540038.1 cutinase family protein [Corynebacterium sp. 366]